MKFNETKSQERLINLMLQAGVEWPDGATHVAQDRSGSIYGYGNKPVRFGLEWSGENLGFLHAYHRIVNWHQTIITREQYEARDGWITWHGGECPVDRDIRIEFIAENHKFGGCIPFYAGEVWDNESNIKAYRPHKPSQPQPEAHDENYALSDEPCKSVAACIPDQPTIEQLIAEWKRLDAVAEKSREVAERDQAAFDSAAEAVEEALKKAGWN